MRQLIVSAFASLDGVVQAPGGPDEDRSGGFALGGWMAAFAGDDSIDIHAAGFDGEGRELLLGRRTYDIFAAYWPLQPDEVPIARTFNAARKHVASRTLATLAWNNATLLAGDAAAAVAALKAQDGPALQVIGSGTLVRTLQAADLVDEYHVYTFPVLLGSGRRLFGEGVRPEALRLLRSRASDSGVLMSVYAPAGAIRLGSFGASDEA